MSTFKLVLLLGGGSPPPNAVDLRSGTGSSPRVTKVAEISQLSQADRRSQNIPYAFQVQPGTSS
jgi:hypothetical protein